MSFYLLEEFEPFTPLTEDAKKDACLHISKLRSDVLMYIGKKLRVKTTGKKTEIAALIVDRFEWMHESTDSLMQTRMAIIRNNGTPQLARTFNNES